MRPGESTVGPAGPGIPFWTGLCSVLLPVAIGCYFRLDSLDRAPLSPAEAFTWRVCELPWPQWVHSVAADTHPPLHFLLLRGWTGLFGDSLVAMRSLSVVLGLLAVAFTALLTRAVLRVALEGRTGYWRIDLAATIAGALAALHPWQILASQTARMYALASTTAAISAWLLWRALQPSRFPIGGGRHRAGRL